MIRMLRRASAPAAFLLLSHAVAVAAQQPDLRALDQYIAQTRAAWDVPGLAVAIVQDGRTVFAKGYGVREAGKSEPVDEHTLFAIASNTKAFTSAGLAMMVDAGKLRWDDRVQQHLPWFQVYDLQTSHEMRIRDILSHRSGLGTYSGDILWWAAPYDAEQVVRRLRYLPQAGPFRASYNYNNLMFITAGEVLHAVSGKPWAQFIREEIFTPLGMSRSAATLADVRRRDNVATPHKSGCCVARPTPIAWADWDAMGAAGAIVSSAHDMAKWLDLQLRAGITAGNDTLFTPSQQWTMWSVHTPQAVSPGTAELYPSTHFRGYGLGWGMNDYKGRRIVSHGGAYDGMYSRVVLIPELKLGMVVLTNSMSGVSTPITNRIMDAYLGGDQKDWSALLLPREKQSNQREAARRAAVVRQTVANTKPSLALGEYAGTFGGPMYGDVNVTLENGGLVLRMGPNPNIVADLKHLQFDTFLVEWRSTWAWFESGLAQFLLSPAGKVTELKLDIPNQDIWFHELELKKK